MNANEIVDALIETGFDASEFVSSIPPETWDTFKIIRDAHEGIRARAGYEGMCMVYLNNEDRTRDFIGYISDTGIGDRVLWQVMGVAIPRPGGKTGVNRVHHGAQDSGWEKPVEAARELMSMYRRYKG
ncbi:MAG: hypothetical protein ACOYB3_00085 [Azonexus sp.]